MVTRGGSMVPLEALMGVECAVALAPRGRYGQLGRQMPSPQPRSLSETRLLFSSSRCRVSCRVGSL